MYNCFSFERHTLTASCVIEGQEGKWLKAAADMDHYRFKAKSGNPNLLSSLNNMFGFCPARSDTFEDATLVQIIFNIVTIVFLNNC